MNRRMLIVAGSVLLLAGSVSMLGGSLLWADAPDEGDSEGTSSEVEKLQGTWRLHSQVIDGTKAEPADFDDVRLIFDENEYTFKDQKGVRKTGSFKVFPRRKPAVLETTYAEEPAEGKTVSRIYQWLDKNTLKMCSPGPDERVPDNFESLTGSRRVLSVWKRVEE